MDFSKYLYENVWILTVDGQEFSGRVLECRSEEATESAFLILKSYGLNPIQIPTNNISQIVVYDQYDPPLPEKTSPPSPDEKEALRTLLIKYRKKAISQGRSTDSLDEVLNNLL